jgi:uncharacterized protein (TIGR03435 family)
VNTSPLQVAGTTTRFDVASVKRSSDATNVIQDTPTRFSRSRAPLESLMQEAFGLSSARIVGGPDWIRIEPYDIIATTSSPQTPSQKMSSLRQLLAERFKLKTRSQTRSLPAWSLEFTRADKRFGPQLRRSDLDCAAFLEAGHELKETPKAYDGFSVCLGLVRGVPDEKLRLLMSGAPMSRFVRSLESLVLRPVIDKTGAVGTFDFDVTYSPQAIILRDAASGTDRQSLTTALKEQLGLKLESTTALVEVLVVEAAERPTPN